MSRSDIAYFGKQCKMPTVVSGLQPRAPNPSFIGAGYWAFLWLQPILLHSFSTILKNIHVTDKMEPSNRHATKIYIITRNFSTLASVQCPACTNIETQPYSNWRPSWRIRETAKSEY